MRHRRLLVAGIVTNGGVASTVRDAHVRDFDVTVLDRRLRGLLASRARHGDRGACARSAASRRLPRSWARSAGMSVLSAEGVAFDGRRCRSSSSAPARPVSSRPSPAREAGLDVARDRARPCAARLDGALGRADPGCGHALAASGGHRGQRAELFAADITAKAQGESDPALVETVTRAAGPALEWLADAHGLPFSLVDDFRYPGHSVLSHARPAEPVGRGADGPPARGGGRRRRRAPVRRACRRRSSPSRDGNVAGLIVSASGR